MARQDETKLTVLLKAIHEYNMSGHYFNEMDSQGKSDYKEMCMEYIAKIFCICRNVIDVCMSWVRHVKSMERTDDGTTAKSEWVRMNSIGTVGSS